ncbi:hypothetical protein K1719_047198 [Acacia pycnantha]|nr:hypothetical protein K1719_047198 [Acacia pycnantha]
MKNVAKCDTWCELQNPVNHRVFERKLRPKPPAEGTPARASRSAANARSSGVADDGLPGASPPGWPKRGPNVATATIHGGLSERPRGRTCARRPTGLGPFGKSLPRLPARTRPCVRRGYPPSLSISISGGKETNEDSLVTASEPGTAHHENRSPGVRIVVRRSVLAADRAQVPRKGAPERVRAPSCPDPVAPRGASASRVVWECSPNRAVNSVQG